MKLNENKCGVTGKLRFDTKEAARAHIAAFTRKLGSDKVTPRCIFCNAYHLTKGARGNRKRRK